MRRLKVDLQDVAMAFEDHGDEVSNYLDMETGRVVSFSGDAFSECEEDDDELREDELGEDDDEGPELPSEPDWMRAERALCGGGLATGWARGTLKSHPTTVTKPTATWKRLLTPCKTMASRVGWHSPSWAAVHFAGSEMCFPGTSTSDAAGLNSRMGGLKCEYANGWSPRRSS